MVRLVDKLLEVMAFRNLFGLAIATMRLHPPIKFAQAGRAIIDMKGPIDQTVGIDGEVFRTKGNGKIEVSFHSQINYLKYEGR